MNEEIGDKDLIGYCGLYCGACRKFKKGKCSGCHLNERANWCKVRSCCMENIYLSCADCAEIDDPNNCNKFNNFISKIFAFIFRSDKKACINKIKEKGYGEYACYMKNENKMTIKK